MGGSGCREGLTGTQTDLRILRVGAGGTVSPWRVFFTSRHGGAVNPMHSPFPRRPHHFTHNLPPPHLATDVDTSQLETTQVSLQSKETDAKAINSLLLICGIFAQYVKMRSGTYRTMCVNDIHLIGYPCQRNTGSLKH